MHDDWFDSPPPAGPSDGAPTAREVFTVSRLNREARTLLERGLGSVWLEGEISNLSRPGSGHWYFSLKDETAQVRCAMFRSRNLLVRFPVKDGSQVLARGRVSLYEARGEFQVVVEHLEEAGEGVLRRRFEALKHILRRRFPAIPVLIYPVAVQGEAAPREIEQALRLADQRRDCDVLILARGGGSLEDLWAFNDEAVARAIFACRIPIVSGIGHEVDFTIADFVADERAPTPSGAAERVVPDRAEWLRSLSASGRRLALAVRRRLAEQGNASARSGWTNSRAAYASPPTAGWNGPRTDWRPRRACCCALRRRCASRPCGCASTLRAAISFAPGRTASALAGSGSNSLPGRCMP